MSSRRLLAAIMFTDIEGYTSRMQLDEKSAVLIRTIHKEAVEKLVQKYDGKVVQLYGDGSLSVFYSAVEAVECAIQLQSLFIKEEPSIPVRIGIHMGDVIYSEKEVIGDAVNIASRIESCAISGSVLISDKVHDQIRGHKHLMAEFLDAYELKNVEGAMPIYAVANEPLIVPDKQEIKGKFKLLGGEQKSEKEYVKRNLWILSVIILLILSFFLYTKISNKSNTLKSNSIAVLPFKNQSSDPDNQYFADGIMDALLNKLSSVKSLRVIPRASMEKYRNTQLTVSEIAEELGVSYILDGSAQKYDSNIRVITELIKADNEEQLWSEDYTRNFEDIFSVQTEIAEKITTKLKTTLSVSEKNLLENKITENIEAYDYFLKGDFQRNKWSKEAFEKAIFFFENAIKLDSNFVDAYVGLAAVYTAGGAVWGMFSQEKAKKRAKELLNKAVHIDPDHFEAHNILGSVYFYYDWNCEQALYHFKRTKEISGHYGNFAMDFFTKMNMLQEAEEAARYYRKQDAMNDIYITFLAQIEMYRNNFDLVKAHLEEGFGLNEGFFFLRESAKIYYYIKEFEKSQMALDKLKKVTDGRPAVQVWIEAGLTKHQGEDPSSFISELENIYMQNTSGSPGWFLALYYFEFGDEKRGFEWLDKALTRREVELTWLNMERILFPYRSDLRYQRIYNEIGFLN